MRHDPSETLAALARGDLAGARELRLPGLSEIPRDLFGLAETLEILDVGDGALTELPADFGRLSKLRVLFCSGNRFERLPPALGDCAALSQMGFRRSLVREIPAEALPPRLRWLTLTDNRIERLPKELGERPLLQKLMLSGNRLTALPASFAGAERLELIRVSANRLEALPGWLCELPGLAWASWSGNPFDAARAAAPAQIIPWREIEIGDNLGEGASGRVHRALWRDAAGDRTLSVAGKLFKGAMTSDGLPDSEIDACLAAGEHPNLIGAHGRVDDHPSGDPALLTPLLPAHWRTLAGPPSAESCSRDVYAADRRMTFDAALKLARQALALDIDDVELEAVAGVIGADGPMCLRMRTAWAEGRGDVLTDEQHLPPLHAVLFNPGVPSPTGAVYRAYDAGPPRAAEVRCPRPCVEAR